MSPLPSLVVTGASGFIGRHLLAEIKEEYRIFAIARRTQRESGAPVHPNIAWMQVDVGDREEVDRAFREVASAGGAHILLHLAAYYDFTGEAHPDYLRTNVEGTRNVLDAADATKLRRVVFASSVAASNYPRPEGPIDERTPPDGEHLYAWSKREGETALRQYKTIRGRIVRFAAVYSDWCEYPPLYSLLSTWLGRSWRSRILAGRGESALPYIHIRDLIAFLRFVLIRFDDFNPGEVLIAGPQGCTSQLRLYQLATRYYGGAVPAPVFLPAGLCGLGLRATSLLGRWIGRMPFERPWMRRYIDLAMDLDPRRTFERVGWSPIPRNQIERRIPFLIERLKSEPMEWHARNLAAMHKRTDRPDLAVYKGLVAAEDQVVGHVVATVVSPEGAGVMPHYAALPRAELAWLVRLVYRLLLASVQSGNRMLIVNYLEVTASGRFRAGFTAAEIQALLQLIDRTVREAVARQVELRGNEREIYDRVAIPFELSLDELQGQDELFRQGVAAAPASTAEPSSAGEGSPRELLEQTIWNCLVQRK